MASMTQFNGMWCGGFLLQEIFFDNFLSWMYFSFMQLALVQALAIEVKHRTKILNAQLSLFNILAATKSSLTFVSVGQF